MAKEIAEASRLRLASLPQPTGEPRDQHPQLDANPERQANRFERLALHIVCALVLEVLQRLDTTLYPPKGTLGRVDAFLAGIPGHRSHQVRFTREVRRLANRVSDAVGRRGLRDNLDCLCIGRDHGNTSLETQACRSVVQDSRRWLSELVHSNLMRGTIAHPFDPPSESRLVPTSGEIVEPDELPA